MFLMHSIVGTIFQFWKSISMYQSNRWEYIGICLLSGVPDYFGRNKISSGGDLSQYSSASLY